MSLSFSMHSFFTNRILDNLVWKKKINTETLELLLNTLNQETDAVFNQHNYINGLNIKATIREKKIERPNP